MEHHKISKLINNLTLSKFVVRKWIQVNDLSGSKYSVNKNIKFKTPTLRSDLCDYSDAYIAVKMIIDIKWYARKNVAVKNNALFRSCISKINKTFLENAEDLDIVVLMYNPLEYSHNYSMTLGWLRKYYKDEIDNVYDDAQNGK